MKKLPYITTLILFLIPLLSASQPEDTEERIQKILSSMSLEEKVGQTCQITLDAILLRDEDNKVIEPVKIDPAKLKEATEDYHIGSILNVGWHTLSLEKWEEIMSDVHSPFRAGKSKTPIIYGIDAIHGANYTVGATLFPQEIGLAASWNKELAQQFGEVVSYETRASGIPWNFSPVLDLGRQPLWSRHFETLGEDPYLASEMGEAIVKGYQGKTEIDEYHVAACLKHFVGYSGTFSGRDRTPAWIPEKYMKELYLPAFKKAVESGALTLMINSGVVNGIPGHANYHLLTEVLKNEWGFKGFTVSDWEDFIMIHTVHRTAENLSDAYSQAFNAGVDMSMVPYSPQYKEYCKLMITAVEKGKISEERLDDAVSRILRVKLTLGLFEKDMNQAKDYSKFGSQEFKDIALESAIESITLLKNENDILPLKGDEKVLVAGPTSNDLIYLNGAWTHTWQGDNNSFNTAGCKNIQEAFVSRVGAESCLLQKGASLYPKDGFEESKLEDIEKFKTDASNSDVIILCLGEYPSTEKPGDIRSLNLPAAQIELAKIAYQTGKPVILVMVEGRPRIIREIVPGAAAIIQAYLPGDYGAEALVRLIYGDENFSGKLPYTYPRYDGVIEFYDHPRSVDRSKGPEFNAYNPQWDFGFGMSYTNFRYSNIRLDKSSITKEDDLLVSVDVENFGNRAGKEVVQLYVSDLFSSLVPKGKSLKGFQKITLEPNERKTVHFTISSEDITFVDANGKWILEAGEFEARVGNQTVQFFVK